MSQNTKGFFRTLPFALLLQAIVLAIGLPFMVKTSIHLR